MNFTTKPDLKAGIVLARGRAGHTSRSHVIAGAEIPGEEAVAGGYGPPAPDGTRLALGGQAAVATLSSLFWKQIMATPRPGLYN